MGGIFGEGIDLIGDRLSGVIVVGVGLPQIGMERDIIRSYYERTSQQGYEFAYLYLGFNKVLQVVGRVIRTEEDRGIVLLIDQRFSLPAYKKLFPEECKKVHYVANAESIRKIIGSFWIGGCWLMVGLILINT
jgi:DNA excision repair protein ERCC-2